jgi:hypothetical protein
LTKRYTVSVIHVVEGGSGNLQPETQPIPPQNTESHALTPKWEDQEIQKIIDKKQLYSLVKGNRTLDKSGYILMRILNQWFNRSVAYHKM